MNIFFKNLSIFSFLIAPFMCGCAIQQKTHGCVSEKIKTLVKGKTTKETVVHDVGDPIVFSSDPQAFHYVQSRVKIASLHRPEIKNVYFYTIVFDDKDVVKTIDRSSKMPWDAQKNITKRH